MATDESLETRLAAVEAEIRELKAQLRRQPRRSRNWLERIDGAFAGDPTFAEIVRLGAEMRNNEPPAEDEMEVEED